MSSLVHVSTSVVTMDKKRDFYVILGVPREADPQKIKKAYWRMARRFHPDISDCEENIERFMEAKEAYDTLGDARRRLEYDRELEGLQIKRSDYIREVNTHYTVEQSRRRIPIDSHELYLDLITSISEAASGGYIPLSIPVIEECPGCKNGGFIMSHFCSRCRGEGRVLQQREFYFHLPPGIRNGTAIRLSLAKIGFPHAYLNIRILVDPNLD